ncbi:aminomethyl-transferring glycine dehydrogenase [Chromobacterium piscinae]|uniref:aminomethyl-transferring glycine dehydrogenase n=1 Tax=Chromobacterium piscinae TaxID=686831 RepID=UPI001C8B77A1|nr:aminomethyl-transferring glycine dehydrogenase [Chromobacterium piscinae]MBX9295443.1 aminomethyl-transferring glycine dehydrogenase [Chromobacterium vaccinii]MBX9346585.1 aminomethyl-transferring glycine dehydrogenase [Chromobacterium vaccinii]MBX9356312.1 aminomethyl-transferring glycine dehydrogenase [Chromobacterium vaccinii]MCD4505844.1 aminomethyl-transferring glycine dehydrogenase [Chromobacterium piscinae]MCD5326336.1 aminomethyl-transferring glycine dehydrogenase [Chromobacterium p
MSLSELFNRHEFIARHIGPSDAERAEMLAAVGLPSIDALVDQTLPADIRLNRRLDLPSPQPEAEALAALKAVASKNVVNKSFIGLGYYPVLTPTVILRNVLENPGWYTAYTPYQAEIAQGRLEALLNFQQMVIDLTGLEMANASLLDEATAAAEAMAMAKRVSKSKSASFFVDSRVLPQTLDVMKTRAKYFGFELVLGHPEEAGNGDYFGALFQYPGEAGDLIDLTPHIAAIKAKGGVVAVAADVMALVALKSPAEMGADIALGNTQRFGVPMGFGGPHAAYFAFKDEMKRSAPGRIIGVSIDAKGKTALRMALQTREQHIRREKANSNICTSQVLLANIAGLYAVYHGAEGVQRIAARIHRLAAIFAHAVKEAGGKLAFDRFFDTVQVDAPKADAIYAAALAAGYNLRRVGKTVLGVAFHEAATEADLAKLIELFTGKPADIAALDAAAQDAIPAALKRESAILTHPVFNTHHSEHEMLRYMKKLENRDLAMNHSMISLGSCTMKLNATSEMIPITWPEFANMHPFAPREQTVGYLEMIAGLEKQLRAITGFDVISMQPNSGAQGEYAGLLAISRYHESRGEGHRDICLIPQSAHGTNPATAQMMNMQVVVVKCDEAGNVDVADLKAKAEQHAANLAALMITYPSTHGVFEQGIKQICEIVHAHGGQVYMDGANLNAQVGLTRPADIGADVSHMNLHKTFCIPHGGGGPGMGPIGLKAHLAPFIANHVVAPVPGAVEGQTAVSAAPFGSASILPISYMYIAMMGAEGMKQATENALLSANYLATRLAEHFPVLYTGANGRVAHECIIDLRPLKAASGVTEVDVAKRLMDYGFHAPTMSFPVPGTLMIEPTESEPKAELDRFIAAMASIRAEIDQVQSGAWPADNNPLCNAPHSKADIAGDWNRPYSREQGLFPLPYVLENKFWPSVNRIDDVYGDRNVVCSCPGMENYA